MNYKSKILRKAQAPAIAKLIMRYIPIIIKRLGKTIGPGGVQALVDSVVMFITNKSQVNEQDARAAAEQYIREHPEIVQQFIQTTEGKINSKVKTSGKFSDIAEIGGQVAGGVAGSAVGGPIGGAIGSEIGGAASKYSPAGMIGKYLDKKMDKDVMYRKYSKEAQDFISKEISHLINDKGYEHGRAVAAAIEIARSKGYEVPNK